MILRFVGVVVLVLILCVLDRIERELHHLTVNVVATDGRAT